VTGKSAFALSLRKDLRAMSPALVASVVVMAAATAFREVASSSDPAYFGFAATAAYVLGSIALGALSVGHEFTHRTLAWLLVQPTSRASLLKGKLAALGILLAVTAGAGWLLLSGVNGLDLRLPSIAGRTTVFTTGARIDTPWSLLLLPLACSVFVAPWLTIWSRSVLAGIVFTTALPALSWLGASAALAAHYGIGRPFPPQAQQIPLQVLWGWCLVLCAAGAVAGWRQFMQWQAIDGHRDVVPFRGLARDAIFTRTATPTRRRFVPWLVVHKELRLQEGPILLAGLYAVGLFSLRLVVPMAPDMLPTFANRLTMGYAVTAALLVGALASAEERRLGTVSWQLLLPVSRRKQWATKVAVALGMSGVLTYILPGLLGRLIPELAHGLELHEPEGVLIASMTTIAIYASSLTSDGVRAWFLAAATSAVVLLLWAVVQFLTLGEWASFLRPLGGALADSWWPNGMAPQTYVWFTYLFGDPAWSHKAAIEAAARTPTPRFWLLVGAVVLVSFAYRNHVASPDAARVRRQASQLLLLLVVAGVFGVLATSLSATASQHKGAWCRAHLEECVAESKRYYYGARGLGLFR
jgi:ABC-type transport system involved in multi-copper enzyme maturation permease subunit